MKLKTNFFYALLIFAVMGFLFYKSVTSRTTSPSVATGHGSAAVVPANAGSVDNPGLAPDFNLPQLSGGSISLASYRDKKPVILDFWASWCHNCQRAMPKLSKMYDKYKDQIEVIGVNLSENVGAVQNYVDRANISFPIALDAGRVSSLYGVRYTNTHVLIDKSGRLVRVVPGDLRESDIRSLLN